MTKIAWRVQRPPGGAAIDHIEHTAVTYRSNCLPTMVSQQPVDTVRHPLGKPTQRLAVLEIVFQVARHIMGIRFRNFTAPSAAVMP